MAWNLQDASFGVDNLASRYQTRQSSVNGRASPSKSTECRGARESDQARTLRVPDAEPAVGSWMVSFVAQKPLSPASG